MESIDGKTFHSPHLVGDGGGDNVQEDRSLRQREERLISRRTVLILGAGASAHLGFPSGRGLLLTIANGLSSKANAFAQSLYPLGFNWDMLNEFGISLMQSMQPSVDAFLENRPEFTACGKAAMAAALIPCENPQRLLYRGTDDSWYEYLFRSLSAREFAEPGRLAFVNFNYDRSLECFLRQAVRNSFGLTEEQANEKLNAISIIHAYGQLAPLSRRPYSTDLTTEAITLSANSIRIIHEGEDISDTSLADARHYISKAEVVAFLGFGFHPVNVSRLLVNEVMPETSPLLASGYSLKRAERAVVKSLFHRDIVIGGEGMDVLWFLRDYPVLVEA